MKFRNKNQISSNHDSNNNSDNNLSDQNFINKTSQNQTPLNDMRVANIEDEDGTPDYEITQGFPKSSKYKSNY
jgi:hypothetical protein